MTRKFFPFKSSTPGPEDASVFEEISQHELLDGDQQNEAEEDEEERQEVLDTWTWQEHQAWLAGVIARRAEDAGLIAKTDQFDWEYHQKFDADIHEAQRTIAQENEAHVGESNDAGENPTTASNQDSSANSGSELGADGSADFGAASFGDLGGSFGGGNPNF